MYLGGDAPRGRRRGVVASFASRAMLLAGLLLVGQGLLVVLRVLDHEAPYATGVAIVVAGAALVFGAWRQQKAARVVEAPRARDSRSWLVGVLGALAAGGVVTYNVRADSGFAAPEFAILGYGVVLMLAAPHLHRAIGSVRVGTLVAYSIPLVFAPLALWALNAVLDAYADSTPMRWYVSDALVAPTAWLLDALGQDVTRIDDTFRVGSDSPLFLTVGVVCAGLYATVIFLGVFALFAWEQKTPPMRLAAYVAIGVVGLHVANILRIALLVVVGDRWGSDALQATHRHAGWVLFLVWSLLFWAVVLRRLEGVGRVDAAKRPGAA